MTTEIEILQFLHYNPLSRRSEILPSLSRKISDRSLMRLLSESAAKGNIEVVGRGPATRYRLTPQAHITMELNLDTYFENDVDERKIQKSFNFELINDILPKVDLLTNEELHELYNAQKIFRQNMSEMSDVEYRKEMERLGNADNIVTEGDKFVLVASLDKSRAIPIHCWKPSGCLEKNRRQTAKRRKRQ